jgi:hypothetical protein
VKRIMCVAATTMLVGSAAAPALASGLGSDTTRAGSQPSLACSSALQLFDGTNLGGAKVLIYTRGLWIDLSTVSFDNRTSSYKVGACAIELASGPGGGGAHYTRCLSAGCVENVMDLGWNNVVSSVYLH